MIDHNLYLILDYDFKHNIFCFQTNIKQDKISMIVLEFLRKQIGAGVDHEEAKEQDLYEIDLCLDLSFDIFKCSHNCGNLGLRDGILKRFAEKMIRIEL